MGKLLYRKEAMWVTTMFTDIYKNLRMISANNFFDLYHAEWDGFLKCVVWSWDMDLICKLRNKSVYAMEVIWLLLKQKEIKQMFSSNLQSYGYCCCCFNTWFSQRITKHGTMMTCDIYSQSFVKFMKAIQINDTAFCLLELSCFLTHCGHTLLHDIIEKSNGIFFTIQLTYPILP